MKLTIISIFFPLSLLISINLFGQVSLTLSGPNPSCGNASGTIFANCTGCTIAVWQEGTINPTNGQFIVQQSYPTSNAAFTYNVQAPGEKNFRVGYSPSGGGTVYTSPITIRAIEKTVAGTLSSSTTALLNSGSGQLTLTGSSGTVTWYNWGGSGALPLVNGNFTIVTTTEFFAELTNEACIGNSAKTTNHVTVKVYKTGTLWGPTSVVEGERFDLSLLGSYSNGTQWEYSVNNGATWNIFNHSYYLYGPSTAGDLFADPNQIWTNVKFRVLVDRGPFGTEYSNTINVAFSSYSQAHPDPANDGNYVREQQVTVSGITSPASVDALTLSQKHLVTVYQDGRGRPVHQNIKNGSPLQSSLITLNAYDRQGRAPIQYLPFATPLVVYPSDPFSEQLGFYANATNGKIANSSYPFAKTIFEKSPLGRILEQGGFGQERQPNSGHSTTITYSNNDNGTSQIRLIKSDGSSTQFYGINELSLVEKTDPDGKKQQTFTDKFGRTVVSRVQLDELVDNILTPWLETYYVYNENGTVKFIISPKGVTDLKAGGWVLTQPIKDQYVYQFVYDSKGRLIEKKVPGQAWVYFCYDRLDRLVLMQDGYQRVQNKWIYIKYDRKGRPVIQGLYTNTTQTTRANMQLNVIDPLYAIETDKYYEERGTAAHGYTNQIFPTVNTEVLTVNYYDTYDFENNGANDSYTIQSLPNENVPGSSWGLPTGSKRVIFGTTTWLYSYIFYDVYGRPIQVKSNNHLSTVVDNLVTQVYDFEGKVLTQKTYHNAGAGKVTTVLNKFNYDHMGRLTEVYQNNNNAPTDQLVAQYVYNEIGQQIDKKLHNTSGTSFLQSIDYRYNIQGWLKSINNAQLNVNSTNNDEANDYFGMEFIYEASESGLSNTATYNGNISAVKWKGAGASAGTADQKSYKYVYDKANRLKTSTSQMYTGSAWTKEADALNENMTYDVNGNIKSLQRKKRKHNVSVSGTVNIWYSDELIDDLTYTYSSSIGDQLIQVTDATGRAEGFDNGTTGSNNDYTYDAMGSLLTDANKSINGTTGGIVYNVLGKPAQVTFSDGRKVEYTYDAAGTKLCMKTYAAGNPTPVLTTDYVGNFVYENNVLSFFGSPEGRVVRTASGTLEYQYSIADHQGNTRIIFSSINPSDAPIATFENPVADGQVFKNVSTSSTFWVTKFGANNSGTKVMRMNSTYNPGGNAPGIGPGKSLSVAPGDVIDMEVWAYYEGGSGFGGTSQSLSALATSVAGVFSAGMPPADATALTAGVNSAYTSFGLPGNRTDGVPSAYLNYILLDKNYKLLDMGWQPVPSTANGTKQKVAFLPRNIKEPGYMYVYLSYEGDGVNWVYFDDLKITHTKSNVIQYNEYYPFGLQAATSWTREGSKNNYLYNAGSELNQGTGWYEMFFRNYDAAIGRLTAIDPLATKYASLSAYHYAFNNPVSFNDPSGAEGEDGHCNTCMPIIDQMIAADLQQAYNEIGFGDSHADQTSTTQYLNNVKRELDQQYASHMSLTGKTQTSQGDWVNGEDLQQLEFKIEYDYSYLQDSEGGIQPGTLEIKSFEIIYFDVAQQKWPDFKTLWLKYPHDVMGEHQHPSDNPLYENQCAIRLSDALIKSGVSLLGYPQDDLDTDLKKWALTANRLRFFLQNNFPDYVKVSQDEFEKNYWNKTGIIFIQAPPGGTHHIDVFNKGQTGSGYYTGAMIWFWEIK
jgi:RHS repeat-associated protein